MAEPDEPVRPPSVPFPTPKTRQLISPLILCCDPETILSRMVEAFDLERFYDSFPALFGRESQSQDSFS